jgi:hypothetical protein
MINEQDQKTAGLQHGVSGGGVRLTFNSRYFLFKFGLFAAAFSSHCGSEGKKLPSMAKLKISCAVLLLESDSGFLV